MIEKTKFSRDSVKKDEDESQLAASGNYSKIAASGYGSQLAASGDGSVVAAIGINSRAKAAKGSWITLAEYGGFNGKYYPVKCVKTEYVDGEHIKADTWYELKNGEFVEVENEVH